jgi:hypothetical protein
MKEENSDVMSAKRLLKRMQRLEEQVDSEEARDEAQRLLLARHLERLRERRPRL